MEEQAEGKGEVKAAVITESSDVRVGALSLGLSLPCLCRFSWLRAIFNPVPVFAHKFHPGVGGVGVTGGKCHMCSQNLELGDC